MKNLFYLLYVVVLVMVSSCQKDESVYSCDMNTNEWVKANLSDIRTISRAECRDSDESLKRAIFRVFTPDQRIDLWVEKLHEVLSLNWNAKETMHIKKLLQYIENNPDCYDFEKQKTEEEERLELFAYKWQEEAINDLKWDMKLIRGIAATGNRLTDKEGNVELNVNDTVKTRSEDHGFITKQL